MILKQLLKFIAGIIILLVGLLIITKQLTHIVIPALSVFVELFAGVALIYFGYIIIRKTIK